MEEDLCVKFCLLDMHLNASIKQPSVNQLASMVQPENIRKYCHTGSFGAGVYSLLNIFPGPF